MRWNKNPASYVAWSFIFILSFGGLLLTAAAVTANSGLPFFAGIGAAVIVAGLLFAVAFLMSKVRNVSGRPDDHPLTYMLATTVIFAVGSIAAFIWRLSSLGESYAESPYYLLTKVVFGQKVPQFVHGALNTYMQFLHEVYFFFGNTAENGIYAQLLLLAAAAVLLGVASGYLEGKFSACITFLSVLFLPGISRDALVLSPALLYLTCWSFVFLLICVFSGKKAWFISAPVMGILIGALIYLDASAILLLAVVPVMYYAGNREDFGWINTAACFGETFLGAAVAFLVSIFVDSLYSGKQFLAVLFAWTRVIGLRIPSLAIMQSGNYVKPLSGIAFAVIILGCFDFWFHKEKETVKGYGILLLLAVLGEIFGLFNNKVPGRMFVAVFLYMLAASMLKDLLFADRKAVKAAVTEKKTPQKKEEEHSDTDRYEKAPEFADKDIVFLENPLPLPKKHVKKVNDFDLDSDDFEDDYDYEVADDDDYDVP